MDPDAEFCGCGSGSSYFRHWPSRGQQKTNLKKKIFCLLLFEGIRIHASDYLIRIRIQEAQKHKDPTDPDLDSDPQHCFGPKLWFSMEVLRMLTSTDLMGSWLSAHCLSLMSTVVLKVPVLLCCEICRLDPATWSHNTNIMRSVLEKYGTVSWKVGLRIFRNMQLFTKGNDTTKKTIKTL